MTRAITLIALSCVLLAGAAATSILGRDSVPAAKADMNSPVVKSPIANRQSKQDRLAVTRLALASFDPPPAQKLSEPLRQAFASTRSADIEQPKAVAIPVPQKPKPVAKAVPQKPYALLSDGQIAGIKERLRLSSDQEYYWPAVENALRAVARRFIQRARPIRMSPLRCRSILSPPKSSS